MLVCRHCGSTSIKSVDRYVGTCSGVARSNAKTGALEFEPGGWTEINWDSCKQVGWQCGSCYASEEYVFDPHTEEDTRGAALALLVCTQDEYLALEEVAARDA